MDPEKRKELFTDDSFDVMEKLEQLAVKRGCTISQFALAWCANQPGVTSPIIGPRTMEQLEDNLGALEIELTDEERGELDEVSPPGKAIVSYYDADFGPEPQRW